MDRDNSVCNDLSFHLIFSSFSFEQAIRTNSISATWLLAILDSTTIRRRAV